MTELVGLSAKAYFYLKDDDNNAIKKKQKEQGSV